MRLTQELLTNPHFPTTALNDIIIQPLLLRKISVFFLVRSHHTAILKVKPNIFISKLYFLGKDRLLARQIYNFINGVPNMSRKCPRCFLHQLPVVNLTFRDGDPVPLSAVYS
ncbi:uncharacterized protein LOC116348219 [Contarinia nasturtii]|uniref:uncharacterized protein LOC116348219 n=1 Tax=Contarinia nasturtii TaxID=265458 RepID=UPI0012D4400D|nr:uncharacterized protein LOC116348219 [Contarinia nasturtii]